MNRAAKIGLGCIFVPVGFTVLMILFFFVLKTAGVPEPKITETTVAQELPRTELFTETTPRDDERIEPSVKVVIELEEGNFTIHPGPAEAGIQVDAEYDEASYKLTQEYDIEGDVPVFRVRLKSKISLLRRIAQDGGIDDKDLARNIIDISLPENTPIALHVVASKSESDFVLDGLALTSLYAKCRMGEYHIENNAPNPIPMSNVRFDVGLGEISVDGLSNFRARQIDLNGGMGEVRLDFGTSLLTDTVMNARMRMGEMTLRVPDDALWNPDSSFKAVLGEVVNRLSDGMRVTDPEKAFRLDISGSVTMGELSVDQFPGRDTSGSLRD